MLSASATIRRILRPLCRALGLSLWNKAQISYDSGTARRACLSSEMPQTWPGRSMQTVKVSSQGEEWLSVRWSAVKIESADKSFIWVGTWSCGDKALGTLAGQRRQALFSGSTLHTFSGLPSPSKWGCYHSYHMTLYQELCLHQPKITRVLQILDILTHQEDKVKFLRRDYTAPEVESKLSSSPF